MTVAYFLHVDGPAGQDTDLQAWAAAVWAPALHDSGEAGHVEAFSPGSIEDPYLASETGKLLIVQTNFNSVSQLETTLAHPAIADALTALPGNADLRVTAEAFTVLPCPLADGSTPPRQAPVSFVVRYYRPVEHEQTFQDHYVAHHPPIMQNFPRIRNIFCYLPVTWRDPTGITPADSFLGNEIVFDSIADLNAALVSDARHDLRADYRGFPPHAGEATHFAMHRRALAV